MELFDLVFPDLIEGVQKLIHFLVSLIEQLILLLVLFLRLLILQGDIQLSQSFLIHFDVLLGILGHLLHLGDCQVVFLHP